MGSIQWVESLSLGVDSIDTEHKKLIKIANAIVEIAKQGDSRDRIIKAFSILREYTVAHFDNEEAYMHSIQYHELGAHRQEHAELKRRVKEYQAMLYHAENISDKEILSFLKGWLVEHVLGSDMKIKNCKKSTSSTHTQTSS